ncbi:hypothetical protein BDA99DRAFT_525440, partial [Phascolomyces articulosus]
MMKMVMITMVRRHNFSIIERGSCGEKNVVIGNRDVFNEMHNANQIFSILMTFPNRYDMVIFIYIGKRKEDNGSNMDWMMMMGMIMKHGMCYHGFFYLFIF